jgi:hypothetical protein
MAAYLKASLAPMLEKGRFWFFLCFWSLVAAQAADFLFNSKVELFCDLGKTKVGSCPGVLFFSRRSRRDSEYHAIPIVFCLGLVHLLHATIASSLFLQPPQLRRPSPPSHHPITLGNPSRQPSGSTCSKPKAAATTNAAAKTSAPTKPYPPRSTT